MPIAQRTDFVVDVPADIAVDADPDQMFRVFTNLIRNAAQVLEAASPRDGTPAAEIRVSARRTGTITEVTVTDTGPGIPQQARLHLFEAFQGSVRKGGTGLGLAICAEILRAHGGTIELAHSGPEGTAFRLTIPDRRDVA